MLNPDAMTNTQLVAYVIDRINAALSSKDQSIVYAELHREGDMWCGNCERFHFGHAMADVVFSDDDPTESPIEVTLTNAGRSVIATIRFGSHGDPDGARLVRVEYRKGLVTVYGDVACWQN